MAATWRLQDTGHCSWPSRGFVLWTIENCVPQYRHRYYSETIQVSELYKQNILMSILSSSGYLFYEHWTNFIVYCRGSGVSTHNAHFSLPNATQRSYGAMQEQAAVGQRCQPPPEAAARIVQSSIFRSDTWQSV